MKQTCTTSSVKIKNETDGDIRIWGTKPLSKPVSTVVSTNGSLAITVLMILVGSFFVGVAEGTCSGSTNPPICDLLPNGNGKFNAIDRVGNTLERIVDDILGSDNSKKENAIKTYGPIENWDVSEVKNMNYLFYEKATFRSDVSKWDVSSVTSMHAST